MKKRLLSLLLAVCMVATLFSGLTVNASAGLFDNAKEKLKSYLDEELLGELDLENLNVEALLTAAAKTETSGDFGAEGKNLHWEVSSGVLKITGSGAMEDFDFTTGEVPPWWNLSNLFGSLILYTPISSVEVADTVTNIGAFAFCALPKVTAIQLPAGLTELPRYSLAACNELAFPTLPETLVEIGDYALAACDKFTKLELPARVQTLGSHAFAGCDGFLTVTVPETVKHLGTYVFASCSGLTSATLPATVTAVPDGTFFNCEKLVNVTYNGAVTAIGEKAFSGCKMLTTAPIPETVTAIGDYAFQDCAVLVNVTLPADLRSLGKGAFSGATLLSSIVLPAAITVVPEECFNKCAMNDVTFAPNTTEIGAKAFELCIKMKTIDLPDTLQIIGDSAFLGCEKLEALELPDGVTTIGSTAFSGCTALTALDIPGSVTSIGDGAFSGCTGLTEVSFRAPTEPQTIGASAFALCTNLKDAWFYGDAPAVTAADATGATFVERVIYIHYPADNAAWVVTDGLWCGYKATPWNVCRHDKDGYALTQGETVAPTCTAEGYTEYTCDNCGEVLRRDVQAKIDHIQKDVVVEPTCTAGGYTKHECAMCGIPLAVPDHFTAQKPHEYELTEVITAPTCTTEGQGTYTCSVCGKTETAAIAKTDHQTKVTTVPATCTERGYIVKVCTVCGQEIGDRTYIGLTAAHTWETVVVAPTCTSGGYTVKVCSVCKTESPNHTNETAPLPHTWDAGKVTTAPTATTDGVKTYTCTVCGTTWTEAIPATGPEACDGGASCPQAKFTDRRAPDYWSHSAIDYCVENGILYGVEDTRFGCTEATTRGQLVTMLYRMQGSPEKYQMYYIPFVDVSLDAYYYAAIAWAYDNGIVAGTTTTTFSPKDPITREQMATILYNYTLKYEPSGATGSAPLNFPDAGNVSKYAVVPLQWAVANDIVSGTKENGVIYLDPKGTATREQVASILMRYQLNIAK